MSPHGFKIFRVKAKVHSAYFYAPAFASGNAFQESRLSFFPLIKKLLWRSEINQMVFPFLYGKRNLITQQAGNFLNCLFFRITVGNQIHFQGVSDMLIIVTGDKNPNLKIVDASCHFSCRVVSFPMLNRADFSIVSKSVHTKIAPIFHHLHS